MTDKIIIKNTQYADSRTAPDDLTKDKLYDDTEEHLKDVQKGMDFFAEKLHEAGLKHDWTKISYFDQYAEDVLSEHTDEDFKKRPWSQKHIYEERHHLNADCPLDVTLIDVFEMIADCVMAGKGRFGRVTPEYLNLSDPSILIRAYFNTVKLLDDVVEIEDINKLNSKTARATVDGEKLAYDETQEEWVPEEEYEKE